MPIGFYRLTMPVKRSNGKENTMGPDRILAKKFHPGSFLGQTCHKPETFKIGLSEFGAELI